MRLILSALIAVFFAHAAFASEQPANHAAATARVAGTPELVKSALIEEMTERQYFLIDQSANTLSFARPIDNSDLRAKLGSLSDPLPLARVEMTLASTGTETDVTSDFSIITEPGRADERKADVAALGIEPRLQDMLDGIGGTVQAIAEREAKAQMTASAAEQTTSR